MNLYNLPWFKFAHEEYLFSPFRAKASQMAKAALLDLLCISMKQTPAMSLPNDDEALAGWIEIPLKSWLQIKALVLSQFVLNHEQNRYYSIMLMAQYAEQSAEKTPPETPPKTAMTGAERVAKHRAKVKANTETTVTPVTLACAENVTSDEIVTLAVTPCNAENVTFGGTKGGEEKTETTELTLAVAEPSASTTRFAMFLAWQPDLTQLSLLLKQLEVQTAHHPDHLARFRVHYQAENRQHTAAQWLRCYAQWLQRERLPVTSPPPSAKTAAHATPSPVWVLDNRPQWEIFAERKQKRQEAAQQAAKQPRPPVFEALLQQMGLATPRMSGG